MYHLKWGKNYSKCLIFLTANIISNLKVLGSYRHQGNVGQSTVQGQPVRYQQQQNRPQNNANRQNNANEKADFKCNFCQVNYKKKFDLFFNLCRLHWTAKNSLSSTACLRNISIQKIRFKNSSTPQVLSVRRPLWPPMGRHIVANNKPRLRLLKEADLTKIIGMKFNKQIWSIRQVNNLISEKSR